MAALTEENSQDRSEARVLQRGCSTLVLARLEDGLENRSTVTGSGTEICADGGIEGSATWLDDLEAEIDARLGADADKQLPKSDDPHAFCHAAGPIKQDDGGTEERATWLDDLEAEIDARLATGADKQLPESRRLHAVSTEVEKALRTVSSDPLTELAEDLEAEIDALLAPGADKQLPESRRLHAVSTEVEKALRTVSSDPLTELAEDLEAEIDALLAPGADKQLPESRGLHAVSTEVEKALRTVSSYPPRELARVGELLRIAAEFKDLDFRLSTSAETEDMAELDARVCCTERAPSTKNGVGEPMVVKRTVCACRAGEGKGGNAALALLPESRGHESGCFVPVGTWSMRGMEGRLDDLEKVTVVAASFVTDLRMAPLLALLNTHMHFLNSCLPAPHDCGVDALIEVDMRHFELSWAFPLLERMVGGRRKMATRTSLRQWRRVASIATTAAETNAQPATQLFLVRKQDGPCGRSAFHSPNPGAEAELTPAPLLASLIQQCVFFLPSGLPALQHDGIEASIEVETRDF
ncbi:unnamed protein product [Pylaiella littoralis]